jgi:hypothetical protein
MSMLRTENSIGDGAAEKAPTPLSIQRPKRRRSFASRLAAVAIPAALLWLGAAPARASVFTLTSDDGFTTVQINTATVAGMTSMVIGNSVNNVQSQGFWVRTGSNAVQPLSSLTLANSFQTFLNYDNIASPPPNTYDDLSLTYHGTYNNGSGGIANYNVNVQYIMNDGGAYQGSVAELVSISNDAATGPGLHSNIALPIDLFEYNHFTPNGDTSNEQVTVGPSDATDVASDNAYNDATQNNVLTGASVAEDNVAPGPTFYQLGTATNPSTYFSTLAGNLPGNAAIPLLIQPISTVGDVEWIFEWNTDGINSIPIGGSAPEISKLITVTVPEPATAALMLGAVGALMARRPRRTTSA